MSLIPLHATDLVLDNRPWLWAEREQARIAAHWAEQAKGNAALFDGRLLVAWRYAIEDGVLRGACLETDFSKFLAWRDFGFPDTGIVNVFAMAALRAEDGAYLMGVMGQHTANPGRIYFPAGTPDPNDVVDGNVDLAGSVIRELMEETGLSADDVTIGAGFTAIRRGQKLAVMRDLTVRGSAEEVQARVRDNLAGLAEDELDDLFIVRGPGDLDPARMPDFIVDFLSERFRQDAG
jgi:8-oxo-dGTP pyrophosphatase MutT (NUDIX family)